MNSYDRKTCIDNIYFLAKQKGILIRDLEECAQLSTGYLSRLRNEDSQSKLTIDALAAIAKKLDASIDTLILQDLTAPTPAEQYVASFLEKLIEQTRAGSIAWEKFSGDTILDTIEVNENGTTSFPLITYRWKKFQYISSFGPSDGCMPAGDFFATDLNNGKTRAFLMQVQHPDADGCDFELYFYENLAIELPENKPEPVCGTDPRRETPLDRVITQLYRTVSASTQNVRLSSGVRQAINEFLGVSEVEVDDGELPF